MKSGLQKVICTGIAALAIQSIARAEETTAAVTATNNSEKISYSIGVSIGNSIKRGGFEVDPKVVGEAINDVLSGAKLKIDEKEAQQTITAYQQELRAKREQERIKLAEKNRVESEKFLAANKQKEGIKTHDVKLGDTTAELQYKVLSEGSGESPKPADTVTFNYVATTVDGKEIDSTIKRGQPLKLVLSQYPIAGVKEALQLMKPGAKWQVFIPPALGFGDRTPAPNIEPSSVLVFEVELVSSEAPQPLTSDIIRVPSKEEMDKGAQPETITTEDLKKMMQTNSAGKK
ncbi:MAG TPA: FKBP-type peptidyl-prolyl cis-trans isomerase [Candidatus Paceibacterota bacterium]|nr:FKBP-type peptidyl-prolyl cis-trans isomerase [Candidatus Paceibacterota bacterium]